VQENEIFNNYSFYYFNSLRKRDGSSVQKSSLLGCGYAQHVITIENQEFTRRETKRKAAEAALAKAVRDANNTNLSKFMNNLESRVYATLSAKLVETMFGSDTADAQNSGMISFEGNMISYQKLIDTIQLTVQDVEGRTTIVDIPIAGIVIPTAGGG